MTMPKKSVIFKHWMNWLDERDIDWAEPCCWACGKSWSGKYDLDKPQATMDEIINNWDRVPLQKCHIIARQFDGDDDPDNLFLMCSECHDKAPDTRSRESFFKWVSKQSFYKDKIELLIRELKNYDIDDKAEEIIELLRDKKIINEMKNDIGIHMNQSKGGSEIKISSIIAALAHNLKSK